jgi:two-component system OmpR family sensor kinase
MATNSPMPNPLYRSLYWRIALGFILCIAGVLTVQSVIVLALLNRTDVSGDNLTQAASATLADAMSTEPQRDLQQYLTDRYPRPSQSLLAVLTTGQVLTAGRKRAPDRVVEAALREFEKKPVSSIPRGWQGAPFHASAILVSGEIVGAVAVVPETWVERLWPALLATGVGLLLVGTALSSAFIFGPAHRRLKELESAALRLGSGDMAVRAREDGGDEVARVALAFNQMAAALAASDRARRLLLADVSHELMTPLTAVRGYQEQLARDPVICDAPSLSRSIAVIGDETLRVERIVGDLLDLAKLEGGGDSLEMQDVSVEGLFGRIAARHVPQTAAKALTFSTSIAQGAEIVYGDRFRLEQALQNLAANAIRHAARGGRVELRAALNGSGTVLAVTDDGTGIAPEHLAFVFDRFYKADSARTGDSGGSGLGLSIVRAIVERHGGTVNVSSEPGESTTFTIWLPPGGRS